MPQNEFKLYSILATGEKQYSFTAGDQIARFATSHGKLLRWHNLIWMNDEVAPQTPFDPDRWHVFLEGAAAMGLSMAVTEFDLNDQLAPGTPEQRV